jgi:hypothetical protein
VHVIWLWVCNALDRMGSAAQNFQSVAGGLLALLYF